MADFICLAMTSQYSDHSPAAAADTSASPPSSPSTFRRSLNLSQGASALLGRRFSRSSAHQQQQQQPSSPTRPDISISSSSSSSASDAAVHLRIVPSIENPRRSLIFDVIDRELKAGTIVKIGRFTDRSVTANHISFKSKVVSRTHCEIWVDLDGKLYLRDTKSSSGTFLNHVRLSTANQESRPSEIHDGDIVQLGVDYQGGMEEMYRAVKMRFELNRATPQQASSAYSVSAFNNLRTLMANNNNNNNGTVEPPAAPAASTSCDTQTPAHNHEHAEVDECVICLYALAPFQALFVAPCSHSYHFKCIRPLLESYPGFQCPICRTYSDLEASVAVEAEEVLEKYGLRPAAAASQVPAAAPAPAASDEQPAPAASECIRSVSQMTTSMEQDDHPPAPAAAAAAAAPDSDHDVQPTTTPYNPDQDSSGDHHHHPLDTTPTSQTGRDATQEQNEEHDDNVDDDAPAPVERRSTFVFDEHAAASHHHSSSQQQQPASPTTTNTNTQRRNSERRMSASNLVDKLKMAFSSEKRKSACTPAQHHSNNNNNNNNNSATVRKHRQRASAIIPISYSNFWRRDDSSDDDDDSSDDGFTSLDDRPHRHSSLRHPDAGSSSSSYAASPSSSPPQRTGLLARTLSAHSNGNTAAQPLADIVEESAANFPSAVRVD